MSVKLRLSRGGAKKRPFYSIVAADSRYPRDGRFIEKIGVYDPRLPKDSENRVRLDLDKAKDWLAKGAQPTDRVARFLGQAGLMEWKHGNNPQKGEPGQKAKEREEERREREEAAKAAAAEAEGGGDDAAAEATPAEDAPADEAAES